MSGALNNPNTGDYPPIQNGKQKRGGLILPADFARIPTSVAVPLTYSNGVLDLTQADATHEGSMSAVDKVRLNSLWQPSLARFYRAAVHGTIANGVAGTILYDTLDYQSNAPFVNAAGVFTLQTGYAGMWEVHARVRWTAVAGATYRSLQLQKNSVLVELDERHVSNANEIINEAFGILNLAVGDTVRAQGLQISGGALAPLNTQSGTAIILKFCGSP